MGLFDKLVGDVLGGVKDVISGKSQEKGIYTAADTAAAEAPLKMKADIRFGSPKPVAYPVTLNGIPITPQIRYAGTFSVSVTDTNKARSCGGIDAVEDSLRKDVCAATDKAMQLCSEQGDPVMQLSSRAAEIAQYVQSSLKQAWAERCGLSLDALSYMSFTMTEESKQEYMQAKRTPIQPKSRICPSCGAEVTSRFCQNCGTKMPD